MFYYHGGSRGCDPQLICGMESDRRSECDHHEVMYVIAPKERYTYGDAIHSTRDYILTYGEITYRSFGSDKKSKSFDLLFLEAPAGFAPANNGVADRGLTAWLRCHASSCFNIIAESKRFVNSFVQISDLILLVF